MTSDEERKRQNAIDYLCRLEEARRWLQILLGKELPPSSELEEHLRNGIELAHLASVISPNTCPLNKIYDPDFSRFNTRGLHYKHTDNIMMYLRALEALGLPKIVFPETTDIYDMKNTTRCIFSIHCLSHFLAAKGKWPLISTLTGEVKFEEQEISKIQKYLEKSGVKMPAFSKIGGILASELSEDDAAVHAAVILVSEAIDRNDLELLFTRLSDPILRFQRLRHPNAPEYLAIAIAKKDRKVKLAELKKQGSDPDSSDVYDRILSRAEMQSCIDTANIDIILRNLNEALKKSDNATVKCCLINDDLMIGAITQHADHYLNFCLTYRENLKEPDVHLKIEDVRNIIIAVNAEEEQQKAILSYVEKINAVLDKNNIEALSALSKNPPKGFSTLLNIDPDFTFQCLSSLRASGCFDSTTLCAAMRLTTIVAEINKSLDDENHKSLCAQLKLPELCLTNIDPQLGLNYLDALVEKRRIKEECQSTTSNRLFLDEITLTVESVNQTIKREMEKLEILSKINEGLSELSPEEILNLLNDPRGMFKNIKSENCDAYLQGLRIRAASLVKAGDSTLLWHEHVQDIVDQYNKYMDIIRSDIEILDALNQDLLAQDKKPILNLLKKLNINGLIPECENAYYDSLRSRVLSREVTNWNGWLDHTLHLPQEKVIYFNHKTKKYSCNFAPEEFSLNVGYLNRTRVQEIISRVGSDYNRELYFKNNLNLISVLQSYSRTLSCRQTFKSHLDFIYRQLPSITLIQAFAKMVDCRRKYIECIRTVDEKQEHAVALKNWARSYLLRSKYLNQLDLIRKNSESIVKLQSKLRSSFALTDYNNLIYMINPSLNQVYKYLSLLELDENDFYEEQELKRLRNMAYEKVREISDIESDVKNLDTTIGLLIKTKINLHELEKLSGKRKKRALEGGISATQSKEQHIMREKYGQIFYLLQHHPFYVARLVVAMYSEKRFNATKEVFFDIFNLGATERDEYHLVKALEAIIELELSTQLDSFKEFLRNESLATKLAITFCRDMKSATFLHTIFCASATELLNVTNFLSLNPQELYKYWINSQEAKTGKKSDLPYEAEAEEALKHPEVCEILKNNCSLFITHCSAVRDAILNNLDVLPYSIRYYVKSFYDTLKKNFNSLTEVELERQVLTVLLYRFLFPSFVDPGKYNIVESGTSDIPPEKTRNLAIVSNLIKDSAIGKIDKFDHPIFSEINNFIIETNIKFSYFASSVIKIESPEDNYHVDQFFDLTRINVPEVKITLGRLIDIHNFMTEYSDEIFPDENDILFKLLRSFDGTPKPSELVTRNLPQTTHKGGKHDPKIVENEEDDPLMILLTLQLHQPRELFETDENKYKELLMQTVNQFIDILHFSRCETIPQVLASTMTEEQEKAYMELQISRDKILKERLGTSSSQSSLEFQSLANILEQVKENLAILEEANVLSPQNDHYDFLLALVRKLSERTHILKTRRMDIARFRTNIDDLEAKIESLNKRKDLFNEFIQNTITGLTTKKFKKTKSKASVKFSATKLRRMGIIKDVEGYSESALKNITFEFKATDKPGTYQIKALIHGAAMLTYPLVFSNLLQLQFNGTPFTKLLDQVTVNVNLLIHFINENFHS